MSTDQDVKTEYTNNARGHMIATSVGGTATGKGGDWVIVDDPVNPKEAQSDAQREEANTFFDQTLTTRLDNKKTGVIIIVMQRLHEKDLTGHVLKKQEEEGDCYEYTQLKLPAEAERKIIVHMPITGKDIVREAGDLLWSEREGVDELKAVKRNLGSYGYAGQYQQDPSPAEGGILKRSWFNRYKSMPTLSAFDGFIISVDCAFKGKVDNDWVVFQAWGNMQARKYLLDQFRRKMDFPDTVKMLKEFCKKHHYINKKVIEDKANGSAVISSLKDVIPGIVAVDPRGGKIARVHAVSPYFEAGNIYIPDDSLADWAGDFVEECVKFPNAEFDDSVDTATQAILELGTTIFVPWGTQIDWL